MALDFYFCCPGPPIKPPEGPKALVHRPRWGSGSPGPDHLSRDGAGSEVVPVATVDRAEACHRRAEQCEQAASRVSDERIRAVYQDMPDSGERWRSKRRRSTTCSWKGVTRC